MRSRDHLVKIGRLSDVKLRVPKTEGLIESAYERRFLGHKQKEVNGRQSLMWEIWNEMEAPETQGILLDEEVIRLAENDIILLGFDNIRSSNNYDMRLRENVRMNPPGLNIRQLAIRDSNSHGGEKALMAVRRQKDKCL